MAGIKERVFSAELAVTKTYKVKPSRVTKNGKVPLDFFVTPVFDSSVELQVTASAEEEVLSTEAWDLAEILKSPEVFRGKELRRPWLLNMAMWFHSEGKRLIPYLRSQVEKKKRRDVV